MFESLCGFCKIIVQSSSLSEETPFPNFFTSLFSFPLFSSQGSPGTFSEEKVPSFLSETFVSLENFAAPFHSASSASRSRETSSASCSAQPWWAQCGPVHLSDSSFKVSLPCPCLIGPPLVGSSGLEPPTSRLSGVRSNHLSYEPMS